MCPSCSQAMHHVARCGLEPAGVTVVDGFANDRDNLCGQRGPTNEPANLGRHGEILPPHRRQDPRQPSLGQPVTVLRRRVEQSNAKFERPRDECLRLTVIDGLVEAAQRHRAQPHPRHADPAGAERRTCRNLHWIPPQSAPPGGARTPQHSGCRSRRAVPEARPACEGTTRLGRSAIVLVHSGCPGAPRRCSNQRRRRRRRMRTTAARISPSAVIPMDPATSTTVRSLGGSPSACGTGSAWTPAPARTASASSADR